MITMSESIPPTRQALAEALGFSTEILRNLELSELQLTNVALKASRLARLLNDFDAQKILEYEVAGYPSTPDGVPPDVYRLARLAGREFSQRDQFAILKAEPSKKYIYLDSIESLEQQIRNSEFAIAAARDPENPGPPRKSPFGNVELTPGNVIERTTRLKESQQAAQRLASRRNFIYQYVLGKHYELKFSGIADDIFSRIRAAVDTAIGQALPESVKRLSAAYENLRSDNPEDWSNAVHSCRRILRDLADALFPSTNEIREIRIEGRAQRVKLGAENYVNRIMAFVSDNSDSERFQDIVGSQIGFLGNRLDSIVGAANKGTHDTIISREEADRYVIYTYLLVGDVLALRK